MNTFNRLIRVQTLVLASLSFFSVPSAYGEMDGNVSNSSVESLISFPSNNCGAKGDKTFGIKVESLGFSGTGSCPSGGNYQKFQLVDYSLGNAVLRSPTSYSTSSGGLFYKFPQFLVPLEVKPRKLVTSNCPVLNDTEVQMMWMYSQKGGSAGTFFGTATFSSAAGMTLKAQYLLTGQLAYNASIPMGGLCDQVKAPGIFSVGYASDPYDTSGTFFMTETARGQYVSVHDNGTTFLRKVALDSTQFNNANFSGIGYAGNKANDVPSKFVQMIGSADGRTWSIRGNDPETGTPLADLPSMVGDSYSFAVSAFNRPFPGAVLGTLSLISQSGAAMGVGKMACLADLSSVDGNVVNCLAEDPAVPSRLLTFVFQKDAVKPADPVFAAPKGYMEFQFAADADSYGLSLAKQADGKVLVAGGYARQYSKKGEDEYHLGLARVSASGVLDTSFGAGGMVLGENLSWGSFPVRQSLIRRLAIDNNGKIVAVGYVVLGDKNRVELSPLFARFNANGTFDTSFNGTGYRILDNGRDKNSHYATDLSLQADGKIVVSFGGGNDGARLGRLNANGSWDTSFGGGSNGLSNDLQWANEIIAIKAHTNGSFIAVGSKLRRKGYRNAVVAKFLADGRLDTAGFIAGKGYRIEEVGDDDEDLGAASVAIGTSGTPVIYMGVHRKYKKEKHFGQLWAYDEAGTRLASFGTEGGAELAEGAPHALMIQADGKVLGANAYQGYLTLYRWTVDGLRDPLFYTIGAATVNVGGAQRVTGNEVMGLAQKDATSVFAIGTSNSSAFLKIVVAVVKTP